jgi:serine/threonine protein kinase
VRSSFTEVDYTLVLLSIEDAVWKIADFGLSAEGMSQRAYSTQRARGTQCYRAPELLSETSIVSRKSDIWAFGCILFELVFPLKAFKNDFQVFQFAASRSRPTLPSLPEESTNALEFTLNSPYFRLWTSRGGNGHQLKHS